MGKRGAVVHVHRVSRHPGFSDAATEFNRAGQREFGSSEVPAGPHVTARHCSHRVARQPKQRRVGKQAPHNPCFLIICHNCFPSHYERHCIHSPIVLRSSHEDYAVSAITHNYVVHTNRPPSSSAQDGLTICSTTSAAVARAIQWHAPARVNRNQIKDHHNSRIDTTC